MRHVRTALYGGIIAAALVSASCASDNGTSQSATAASAAAEPAMQMHMDELPATDGAGFVVADVRFMQNMIGHHAQAVVMSAWAPGHGASADVLKLAQKIGISQTDEIGLMRRWLAERKQVVPTDAQAHAMMMPGMLTPDQMANLDAARGHEFDRLYLAYMIGHHRGAVDMVARLFGSPGAGQDSDIFRFATDVDTDQRDEIFLMQRMLDTLAQDSGR